MTQKSVDILNTCDHTMAKYKLILALNCCVLIIIVVYINWLNKIDIENHEFVAKVEIEGLHQDDEHLIEVIRNNLLISPPSKDTLHVIIMCIIT